MRLRGLLSASLRRWPSGTLSYLKNIMFKLTFSATDRTVLEAMSKEDASEQFAQQFEVFCNFGVPGGKKTTLTDKNLTKIFKDCKLYTKSLTTVDTDIAFNKVKEKGKKEITIEQFRSLLKEVAPKYQKDNRTAKSAEEAYTAMVHAIISCGPEAHGTTKVSKTGAVDRMTDTSLYTGSHKERFDESGKGRGLDGRVDAPGNDGYVQGYKEKDTYDKRH